MLRDVEARVISNTRLSPDYNVIALAAPEIAEATQPGQFVMVKSARSADPLLRRPFSVFEVLRSNNRVEGLTLLSKRIGVTTKILYDAVAGDRIACLGPLGRPFEIVDPPVEAWMVAGGVGLAPFVTLAEALRPRGVRLTLFYGGRSSTDLFCLDVFEALGVRIVLATEDGSRGELGRITVPLDRELQQAAGSVQLYACGPEPMLAAVARLAAKARRRCEVSVERTMGCGMGGCYSCVVQVHGSDGKAHYVRSCTGGPVFDAGALVWE